MSKGTVRQTHLNYYRLCPRLYKCAVDAGDIYAGEEAQEGKLFHDLAAQYARHCMETGQPTDVSWATELARRSLALLGRPSQISSFTELWEAFVASHSFPYQVMHVEIELADERVTGKPDLVWRDEFGWHIVDYKTHHRIPPASNDQHTFQLALYAHLASSAYGFDECEIVIDYVRYNFQRRRYLDQADLDEVKTELDGLLEAIESNPECKPWPGSHCSWCPFYDDCPETKVFPDRAIRTEEEAIEAARSYRTLKRRVSDLESRLKGWCDLFGPLEVDDEVLGFRPRERTRIVETEKLVTCLLERGLPREVVWDQLSLSNTALARCLKHPVLAPRRKEIEAEIQGFLVREAGTVFGFKRKKEGENAS